MIHILDHGYVKLIETWGSDERIVESARMSTGKGFLGWGPALGNCAHCNKSPDRESEDCDSQGRNDHAFAAVPGDEKLLAFLWQNKHAAPFEMAGAIFEIQAPIFVFREWHRHRTQSYNEMSARYAPLPNLNYIPSVERLMVNGGSNKQAGTIAGAAALTVGGAANFREELREMYDAAEHLYQKALAAGVPKELARVHLPVARYSRMRASANLRNWLAFLTLRSTPKNHAAQWEIRQFADPVHDALAGVFPRTLALFDWGAT